MLETIKQGRARARSSENKVASVFEERGWSVSRANWYQEVNEDIDLIVTKGDRRLTISVKAQEAGLAYGHVYAELWEGFVSPIAGRQSIGHAHTYIDGVRYELTKYEGWLRFGQADCYAIAQGDELILIRKAKFERLVDSALQSGRARLRYLSENYRRRALEQGHPALTNQSIYLDRELVKRHAEVISLTNKEVAA